MEYGKRLNPERSLKTPKGIKGTRQKVIVPQLVWQISDIFCENCAIYGKSTKIGTDVH